MFDKLLYHMVIWKTALFPSSNKRAPNLAGQFHRAVLSLGNI